tara:strand:+ start:655 stop:858 length:204 start_codon:yes stop_codon:yes gene_type:complete
MAVEIKELIIQGRLKDETNESDQNLSEIIRKEIKEGDGNALQETEKRQLVDECVAAVLKELESKFDY